MNHNNFLYLPSLTDFVTRLQSPHALSLEQKVLLGSIRPQ